MNLKNLLIIKIYFFLQIIYLLILREMFLFFFDAFKKTHIQQLRIYLNDMMKSPVKFYLCCFDVLVMYKYFFKDESFRF